MHVNDENPSATTPGVEPAAPPVDPADRPRIEPTDALPTEELDEPGFLDNVKSFFNDEQTEESAPPAPLPTSAEQPTPPPVDPEDRPRIEPTDALPTEE